MSQSTETLSPEVRRVVEFFKGLIPILREVVVDLEKKNLLDEKDLRQCGGVSSAPQSANS